MFSKKENVLDFACQSCGSCCKYFNINITHIDLERIIENRPDLTTKDFVSYVQANPKEPEDESFISTYGKRELALKKKKGKNECVFLDDRNMCSIHEFKPIVCRVWPFSLEKGVISWIEEHSDFIKKTCKHKMIEGTNDRDELITVLKQHNRERKIYSKLVKIWNDEKKQEVNENELFSDILDEHFLDYIIKEINSKNKSAEKEAENEDIFYGNVINNLIKDRRIEVITENKLSSIYSYNKKLDLSLSLYIQEQNIESFKSKENIEKLKKLFNSDFISFSNDKYNNDFISFSIEEKTLILKLMPFSKIYNKLSYDTLVIYNPYQVKITKMSFDEEKNIELKRIYDSFYLKLKKCLAFIKNKNTLEFNLLFNNMFQEEFLPLIFWINGNYYNFEDIKFIFQKTDDLEVFIKKFFERNESKTELDYIKDFHDIFTRNWAFSNIKTQSDNNFIIDIKNFLL
ncbi:MAG: YkgJ family cysteine cluster protein [Cyanobacteriota bacterium]